MPSEKSASLPEMDLSCECGLFPPGGLCSHHPFCIDKGGNASVGYANQIPAAFDGTNGAEIVVMTITRRVFPPSVVCDHRDKALLLCQVLSAVEAEYRFKTNDWQDVYGTVGRYKSGALLAVAVGAGVSAKLKGKPSQKAQIFNKGHPFKYGNQLGLVIELGGGARRPEKRRIEGLVVKTLFPVKTTPRRDIISKLLVAVYAQKNIEPRVFLLEIHYLTVICRCQRVFLVNLL